METLHPLRSIALGVLAVLTTVGGFTLGRQQLPNADAPVKVPTIDYTKIPADSTTYLALHYAQKLELTPSQTDSVRRLQRSILPMYEAYARTAWQAKLEHATQEDEGTVVDTEFWGTMWMPKDPNTTTVREDNGIKALLTGDQRKALFHLRYDVQSARNGAAMDIAYEPATMSALKLSKRQQNQFATLLAMHKKRLEEITGPNRKLAFSVPQYKFFTYYAIQKLLDPYQRLALEAIVRERLYVKP